MSTIIPLPPILLEYLAKESPSVGGMFLAQGYFYMRTIGATKTRVRQVYDKTAGAWVDTDPARYKTADYRTISLVMARNGARVNDIADFLKISVQAANGHASGAGDIARSKT